MKKKRLGHACTSGLCKVCGPNKSIKLIVKGSNVENINHDVVIKHKINVRVQIYYKVASSLHGDAISISLLYNPSLFLMEKMSSKLVLYIEKETQFNHERILCILSSIKIE